MDAELERQLLGALMDDSLDASRWRSLQASIAGDPRLQREFRTLCRVREAVRQNASRYAAPASLRARVRMIGNAPAPAARRPVPWDWRHAFGLSEAVGWRHAAAFGAAALTLSAALVALPPTHGDERLMQAAASSYLGATSTQLLAVASSNADVVQPWLSEQLRFRVPVHVPALSGATLLGGRLDKLETRTVAALVYRMAGHTVQEFVWSADDDSSRMRTESVRGLNLTHWSRGGLRYCVVSDLPQGQLVAFAESLAQAGDGTQEVNP
jgi:anti-sigma factor RsiW